MKSLRKLIPAVCLLLVSAILLSTSTFAWFSLNASVSATGMKIQAADAKGTLLIAAKTFKTGSVVVPDKTSMNANPSYTVDLSGADYKKPGMLFQVSPVAHQSIKKISEGEATETKSGSVVYKNWGYKYADKPDSYSSSATSFTPITSLDGYVVYYDLYVTVAIGSQPMNNLKASVTITASNGTENVRDAMRVLVATDYNAEEFYNAHKESGTSVEAHTTGTENLTGDTVIDEDTIVHIKLYIYVDGEDATIFTKNVKNLKDAQIDVSFSAKEVEAAK